MAGKLRGIIPPMTTPFRCRPEIQWDALRAQVRRLPESGIHGLEIGDGAGDGQVLDRD